MDFPSLAVWLGMDRVVVAGSSQLRCVETSRSSDSSRTQGEAFSSPIMRRLSRHASQTRETEKGSLRAAEPQTRRRRTMIWWMAGILLCL
jgi:hypothetical protein